MKKTNIFFIIIVLFSQALSAQKDSTIIKYNKIKNSIRIGAGYCIQGNGDQVNVLYKTGYQRKLNNYFELDLGMAYFNYEGFDYPNYYEPEVTIKSSTSILNFDLVLNLLIINFNKHILKLGAGYSLQKINLTAWSGTHYYFDDNYNYSHAVYTIKTANDFKSSIIVNVEYGYMVLPHLTATIYGKYYSENELVSLASLGLNFYYTF